MTSSEQPRDAWAHAGADTGAGADAARCPMPSPFDAFTDPDRALVLLQGCSTELFGAPTMLTRCDVITSLYKTYVNQGSWPQSTLSVCWRLEREDAADGATFYAKVYLEGRSRAAWGKLCERAANGSMHAPAAMHLPMLDMIAWRFPDDPTLQHLPDVVLDARVRVRLPWDALRLLGAGAADLAQLRVEPVRYQPEKSCITRCLLRWPAAANAAVTAPRELVVYGKAYGDDRGPAAYARQHHFWRTAALRTCEPLAWDDAISTVWSIGVEGRPLADVIDHANHVHYLDQVAGHLAAVHGSDAGELHVVGTIARAELLADGLKKIDKLGRACPPSRAALASLAAAVRGLADEVMHDDGERRVLHGDFHLGQMLDVGTEVYLFDFDSLALGDAEQDLAEFVVAMLFMPSEVAKSRANVGLPPAQADDVHVLSLRGTFGPGFDSELNAEFIGTVAAALGRAYGSRVRWPVRPDHLQWYARVEFVTRCWRFHRQQRPGWADALQLALTRLPVLDTIIAAMAAGAARKCS